MRSMVRVVIVPLCVAVCAGCRAESSPRGAVASATPTSSSAAPREAPAPRDRHPARRGLGSLSARVPGTNQIVGGVSLVSHRVTATVRAGFARTEIEEVWRNDDPRALEGTFTFALPAAAAITRLALEVDGKLVEGELVEQKRAATIFRGIVDDTVRPRDPALLDQRGGKVDLKIFPLPPRGGTRRVVLAYDEILPERADRGVYVLPLTSGTERETTAGELRVDVTVEGASAVTSEDPITQLSEGRHRVSREAREVAPKSDLVVRYTRPHAAVQRFTPRPGEAGAAKGETASGFVTARLAVPPAAATSTADPRVYVVDVGHGQPADALVDAWEVIDAALAAAPDGAPFAVLACDSACESFPPSGLGANTAEARGAFTRWSTSLSPRGASDLAGMLLDAARVAGPRGAVAWFTRGAATAGEPTAADIAARVRAASPTPRALHVLGTGPFVDEPALRALSEALGATLTRLTPGDAPRQAARLDRPVLHGANLVVPTGMSLVAPTKLPALAAGDELVVSARATPDVTGDVTLTGELDGAPVSVTEKVPAGAGESTPLLGSVWARARITSLASMGDPSLDKEIAKLSRDFHVLSPRTSFLVLENEAMFAAFGIPRTSRRPDAQQPPTASGSAPARKASAVGPSSVGGATSGGVAGPMSVGGAGSGMGSGAIGGGDVGGLGGLGQGSPSVDRPRARVALGAVNSSPPDRLPRDVATRSAHRGLARFRRCAELALAVDPGAVGRVSVTAMVGPDGSVQSAVATPSGVSSQAATCMSAATRALRFPSTEGGPARVSFTVSVSRDERPIASKPTGGLFGQPVPTFSPARASDAWLAVGDDEIGKAMSTRDRDPQNRRAHEALVLALSRHGRDATDAARAWVAADPDEARAHGALAEALAAGGALRDAAFELGAVASLDPGTSAAQLAAARAFAGAGDARRACAHVRAASASRDATPQARAEALRCRAEVLGDASARAEARELSDKHPAFKAVADGGSEIELGTPGALRFESRCAECPPIYVLTPTGRVVAAVAPSRAVATARRVDAALTTSGTYRVVFAGAAPSVESELVLTTPNGPQTFKVPPGSRTLASVEVQLPPLGFGFGSGFGPRPVVAY